jgi:hypothetical protein
MRNIFRRRQKKTHNEAQLEYMISYQVDFHSVLFIWKLSLRNAISAGDAH